MKSSTAQADPATLGGSGLPGFITYFQVVGRALCADGSGMSTYAYSRELPTLEAAREAHAAIQLEHPSVWIASSGWEFDSEDQAREFRSFLHSGAPYTAPSLILASPPCQP